MKIEMKMEATVTAIVVVVAAAMGLRAPVGAKARDLFLQRYWELTQP